LRFAFHGTVSESMAP